MARAMACAITTRQRGRESVRGIGRPGDQTTLADLGRAGLERNRSPELSLDGEIDPSGQHVVLGRLEFDRLLLIALGEHHCCGTQLGGVGLLLLLVNDVKRHVGPLNDQFGLQGADLPDLATVGCRMRVGLAGGRHNNPASNRGNPGIFHVLFPR